MIHEHEAAVRAKVHKAMQHANTLGAGASKRANLSPKEKEKTVMAEWQRGTLHSGSGQIVPKTRPDIAYAIAKSEGRRIRR